MEQYAKTNKRKRGKEFTAKKLIFLVMADDAWHEDIWLRWAQMRQGIHFIVHYWKQTERKNDTSMVTYHHQEVFNVWNHLIDLQFFLLHRAHSFALSNSFRFEHCAFISGKCVPICPLENVLNILIVHKDQSLLQTDVVDPKLVVRHKKGRKNVYDYEIAGEKFYFGPNWFILCYKHVDYLLQDIDQVADEFYKKWVYLPCYYDIAHVTFRAESDKPGVKGVKGTNPINIDEYGICTILSRKFMDSIVNAPITDYVLQSVAHDDPIGIPHPLEFTNSMRDQIYFWRFINNQNLSPLLKVNSKIVKEYHKKFLNNEDIEDVREYSKDEYWKWTPWKEDNKWTQLRFFARKLCSNPCQEIVAVLEEKWNGSEPIVANASTSNVPRKGARTSTRLSGTRAEDQDGANEHHAGKSEDATGAGSASYGKALQHMQYPTQHRKSEAHQQRGLQIQKAIKITMSDGEGG